MSSIIDDLYQLKYNPFEYGSYLASFYRCLDESEENLLLAQLVIPLCAHPKLGQKISGAMFGEIKRSSIWSIFDDRVKLYDMQERIDEFKSLTRLSIQYCLTNDWLFINNKMLSLVSNDESDPKFTHKKCAEKLGRLFNGHSVVEIYSFLGVHPR